jgi:hypothetical protein
VETTQAIRAGAGGGASAGAPVIALTAHALPAEIEGFRATGMGEVLIKPLRREALAAALSRIGRRTVLASASGVRDPGAAPSGGDPSLPILDQSFLAELRADIGPERTERFLGDFLRDGAELAAGPPNGTLDPHRARLSASASTTLPGLPPFTAPAACAATSPRPKAR